MNYREELQSIAEGIDINRYYDAWRLTLLLWRSIWYNSDTTWRQYRARIWNMFSERLHAAARTSSDLDMFMDRFGRMFNLNQFGANIDDRAELARLLALPAEKRRAIMQQLRENNAVLVALVRRWRDVRKEEMNEED